MSLTLYRVFTHLIGEPGTNRVPKCLLYVCAAYSGNAKTLGKGQENGLAGGEWGGVNLNYFLSITVWTKIAKLSDGF